MRNKTLQSFIDYADAHPEQRFWQVLRNWSGFNFIYGSMDDSYKIEPTHLQDTFYIEDENNAKS
jgi:hypothetical protein